MSDYQYKQVIVLRKDLNMRKGKMAAQAAHASLSAVLSNIKDNQVAVWLKTGQAKIVVSVDSEEELLALEQAAKSAGLINALIVDSGYTEFDGVPTITALAVGPGKIAAVDKVTSHLKLL